MGSVDSVDSMEVAFVGNALPTFRRMARMGFLRNLACSLCQEWRAGRDLGSATVCSDAPFPCGPVCHCQLWSYPLLTRLRQDPMSGILKMDFGE